MAGNCLLGIDVGTTGTKALLMTETGKILGTASKSYPLLTPGLGLCEQRASDWWDAVVTTVREVCSSPSVSQRVRGISLSTQGGTIVPTDANFNPLGNAIVWSDARCVADKPAFDNALGEGYIYHTCGWKLNKGLPAMQLRHMRLNSPSLFQQASYFLSVSDFILAHLTGNPVIDLSNAGINHLTDVQKRCYDSKILEFVGIDEKKLASLAPSCTPVGTLTQTAAAELGLSSSVIVSTGAHDQYAVALGAGICKSGDAVIGTGTAWVVTALRNAPDFSSDFSQSVSATEGKWGTMLSISTGGVCLDWFRKQIAGFENASLDYETINTLALQRDTPGTGGLLFYPYFNGAGAPDADNCSRATLLGLDLSHDRGHIAHAVMEGVACQIVCALRALEKYQPIHRLVLAGGATNSPLWTKMVAEIAGRSVHISKVNNLACAGAAMMAGVGCGLFQDTKQAASLMTPPGKDILPTSERVQVYQDVYDNYCRKARALRALYEEE